MNEIYSKSRFDIESGVMTIVGRNLTKDIMADVYYEKIINITYKELEFIPSILFLNKYLKYLISKSRNQTINIRYVYKIEKNQLYFYDIANKTYREVLSFAKIHDLLELIDALQDDYLTVLMSDNKDTLSILNPGNLTDINEILANLSDLDLEIVQDEDTNLRTTILDHDTGRHYIDGSQYPLTDKFKHFIDLIALNECVFEEYLID
jgi:hypothetical protein